MKLKLKQDIKLRKIKISFLVLEDQNILVLQNEEWTFK